MLRVKQIDHRASDRLINMVTVEVVDLNCQTGNRRQIFKLKRKSQHFIELVIVLDSCEQLRLQHLVILYKTDFNVDLKAEIFKREFHGHCICSTCSGLMSQNVFGDTLKIHWWHEVAKFFSFPHLVSRELCDGLSRCVSLKLLHILD